VGSQIQTFLAPRNCTRVGVVSIAGTVRHGGRLPGPDTLITGGPSAATTRSLAVFTFVSTVAGSRFQCRLDGGPWVRCASPVRYTGLVNGSHTFDVRAISRAGAKDRSPAHAAWLTATPAATPYLGWNTYYGVGGIFDEQTILSVANALIDRGLASAGYRIVWLDFGWASGARDISGQVVVDPNQWPHGLPWLTDWLHAHGLLAGIYTDAGASGCSHKGVGSLGHYQQDADAFAAWGFDAVKVDFCGAGQAGLNPQVQYPQFANALQNNASRRPMLLNVDNFWVPGQVDGRRPSLADSAYSNYLWAPQIAQSWRTDTDIGFTRDVEFVNVLRNLDHDAAHAEAAGPGHWNDPDYLAPNLGMTAAQAQAQLTMWAILAAPLILGSDPRSLSPTSVSMLENGQVIAIDQDPLGFQGTLIAQQGSGQVWVKPLAGGDAAVALLNRSTNPLRLTTRAAAIGLPRAHAYTFRDIWRGTTGKTSGAIDALVPADSAVLYRVAAS
jgi:alpha-galactosidase